VIRTLCLSVCLLATSIPASAATIGLYEAGFNIDGTVPSCLNDPLDSVPEPCAGFPSSIDTSDFSLTTGLGTITFSVTAKGAHQVVGYFDLEFLDSNNSYVNEYGQASGIPLPGQRWEIDEPGFIFGDIYTHVFAGAAALDNLDSIPGPPASSLDDVAMAHGWSFILGATDTATIAFVTSLSAPGSGFYTEQIDPVSGDRVFLQSSLAISPIPEPSTWLLMASGLVALRLWRKR